MKVKLILLIYENKEKFAKVFLTIAAAIFLIPAIFISVMNPFTDSDDPYTIALNNIQEDYKVIGNLDAKYLKAIDNVLYDDISDRTTENVYKDIKAKYIKDITIIEQVCTTENISYCKDTPVTKKTYKSNKEILDYLKTENILNNNDIEDIMFMLEITGSSSNGSQLSELGISLDIKSPTSGIVTAISWTYPCSFGGGWHPGIDIGAPFGTPIVAPADTIVLYSTEYGQYGMTMMSLSEVDGEVYTFIYGHMQKVFEVGVYSQGEQLAEMGSTGMSTGSHLHFEVFKHGSKSIDEIIKEYENNNDIWFGLGYNSKGDCSTVCRLAPHVILDTDIGRSVN